MGNKKIVVGNMKMNLTAEEISDYLKEINGQVGSNRVVICPTSIYIPYFLKQDYLVGLQNTFLHESGAYTGEISPKQTASMGIAVTIIGHSERRMYFDEKDKLINEKVKEAIKQNLRVILCIGETAEERNMMRTEKVLRKQILGGLRGLEKDMFDNVILAYEPIWAIGTGEVPTNEEITKTIGYIKSLVLEIYNYESIPVLYGGSVTDKNIKELNKIPNVSGFLVGGASTKPKKFLKIIEVAVK